MTITIAQIINPQIEEHHSLQAPSVPEPPSSLVNASEPSEVTPPEYDPVKTYITGTAEDEGTLSDDEISGFASKRIIFGGEGNDTISGLGGNDKIYGQEGNDWLEGGAGNDYLMGGTGSDVYYFERGWGQDTIHNYAAHEVGDRDVIRFGAGIKAEDITVSRDDNGFMILSLKDAADTITVRYQFYLEGESRYAINGVEFADGTVWTPVQLMNMVSIASDNVLHGNKTNDVLSGSHSNEIIFGYGGNDVLNGGAGNDFLEGGTGNDYLVGGTGSDVYYFERGWGQDTIHNYAAYEVGDRDVIRFGPGISASDIIVNRDDQGFMTLSLSGTTDTVTVRYQFYLEGESRYAINGVEFADGTVWTPAQLKEMVAIADDRIIHGDATNNVLTGSSNNEIIYGYGGHDTLNGGDGNDTLYGGNGYDTLNGGDGNDWLEGGSGNDYLMGDAGSDIYYFERGWGQDTIHNFAMHEKGDRDVIRFGEGILPEDIRVSYSDLSLFLSLRGTYDKITIYLYFHDGSGWGGQKIDAIEFADGTVWETKRLNALMELNLWEDQRDTFSAEQEVQSLISAMAALGTTPGSETNLFVEDGLTPVGYLMSTSSYLK